MASGLILAGAPLATSPVLAQGSIGTVDRGHYSCELPGDAAGRAGVEQPQSDFTITSASRYESAAGGGTYLRRGDMVAFTSGPRSGEKYHVVSNSFMRLMENGKAGRLRCVRHG